MHIDVRFILSSATAATLSFSLFAATPAEQYVAKPDTWTTWLIDNSSAGIKDADFAGWWKTAAASLSPDGQVDPKKPPFRVIYNFSQCFGGGFITAVDKSKGGFPFNAHSASRYDRPAYYRNLTDEGDSTTFLPYWGNAWISYAADKALTAKQITAKAWDGESNGDETHKDVVINPMAQLTLAQYLDSGASMQIDSTSTRKLAIIFVGLPHANQDGNEVTALYNRLTGTYNFKPADIMILYGNGIAPLGAPWTAGNFATSMNLENTIKTWMVGRIKAMNARGQSGMPPVQVLFWAGDHGNADFPMLLSVGSKTIAVKDSGVDKVNKDPKRKPAAAWMFEGGSLKTVDVWRNSVNATGDIDAFAFDFDLNIKDLNPQQTYLPPLSVVFSVDLESRGAVGSDVRGEIDRKRAAATDVFVATANSNRQMMDGGRQLALLEVAPKGKPAPKDDLNALSSHSWKEVFPDETPDRPLFISLAGSGKVWVIDPNPMQPFPYEYVNWGALLLPEPVEVDALALLDDGKRYVIDPITQMEREDPNGRLRFTPGDDRMLLSVGRTEVMAPWKDHKPCDVLSLDNGPLPGTAAVSIYRSCESIGLDPKVDNLDALDVLEGQITPPPCTMLPGDPSVPSMPKAADLTGDGLVNSADLGLLLAAWGPCLSFCGCSPDMNSDGTVDGADLGLLLAAWTG